MIGSSVVKAGLLMAGAATLVVAGPALVGAVNGSAPTSAAMPVEYELAQQRAAENMADSHLAVVAATKEREAEAKARARAKKKAAAKKRAAQEAAAARARAAGGTPAQNRALGMSMCADKGWSAGQCADLGRLWDRESGWSTRAHNSSSGAHGIPQALPGSKMAAFGSDWATNPRTQIAWGLNYIARAYGNPSNAWAHVQRTGWY